MKFLERQDAARRWILISVVATLAAALLPLAHGEQARGDGGDLDPGYGNHGIALVDAGLGDEEARSVTLLPDGDVVVTGAHHQFEADDRSVQRTGFAARFGRGGQRVQAVPALDEADFRSMLPTASAAAPGGKLVVAASPDSGASSMVVFRYLESGTLDPSFGQGGAAILGGPRGTTLSGNPLAVAVAPDGAVLVAGRNQDAFGVWSLVVGRLRPDGRTDTAFGDGGAALLELVDQDGNPAHTMGQSVALLPDGRVMVAGTLIDQFGPLELLARYTSAGRLDRTFNKGAGFTVGPAGDTWAEIASSVAVLPDGRAMVAGTRIDVNGTADLFLRRHLPDGRADPSFGGGGLTAGDSATDEIVSGLAIDGAGRAVVVGAAGRSGASADVLLARYLPDGRPDPAFAGGGPAHVDLGGDDVAVGLVLDDGRPVVAATTEDGEGTDLALLRFTDAGRPDVSFGGSGRVLVDLAGWSDERAGMAVGPDGSVTSVGMAYLPTVQGARQQGIVVRQRPDGPGDDSFHRRGVAFTGRPGRVDTLRDALVLPDGSTVVVGGTKEENGPDRPFVLRLRPDGSPDPTFGHGGEIVGAPSTGEQFSAPYEAVGVTADGRLRAVAVQEYEDRVMIAGYLRDGRPDTDFGTAGVVAVKEPYTRRPWNLVITADGGVVLGGGRPDDNKWSLLKLDAAGRPTDGFGRQLPAGARFRALAAAPDGTVIVAGTHAEEDRSTQLVVARLTADGRLDRHFDCDGLAFVPFAAPGRAVTVNGVAIGADGRIVVAGTYRDGEESPWDPPKETGLFAARWLADGSRDTSLSTDGVASSPLPGWRVVVAGVGLAGDSPVLAGSMAPLGGRRSDGFSVRFAAGSPPPAPEPASDRLLRCGTKALSGGDVDGVVQAVTIAADELAPAHPTPPAQPALPAPSPPTTPPKSVFRHPGAPPLRLRAESLLPPGRRPTARPVHRPAEARYDEATPSPP